MSHKTARVYSCIHSAITYLSNSIHSTKDGKHGVELERSDYRTLEIGEGKFVTPLPSHTPVQTVSQSLR